MASPADMADSETVLALAREARPDVVLLDLDLGVLGDGSRLVAPLVQLGCRVLVVTASGDQDQICRALENGAVGVVAKSAPFDRLLDSRRWPRPGARRCCPRRTGAGCSRVPASNAAAEPRRWRPSNASARRRRRS